MRQLILADLFSAVTHLVVQPSASHSSLPQLGALEKLAASIETSDL